MTSTMTDVQQPDYSKHQQTQRLDLTPEEIKAWQSCMKNSSVIVPTAVSAALGYGICSITPFRANAKYAALISGIIGMITSRISLSEICLAKVASMPNSNLRERMMQAGYGNKAFRDKQYQNFQPLNIQTEIQGIMEPSAGVVFDDYPPMNSYDTYSSINGSNDSYSEDTDLTEPINLQKGASYDELRQKNRDEFYKKSRQWNVPNTSREPTVAKETTKQAPIIYNPASIQEKTKYGDVWG